MAEPIRSMPTNDKYRKGWDKVFGKSQPEYLLAIESHTKDIETRKRWILGDWDIGTWCSRCKCSHFPKDIHVDGERRLPRRSVAP